MLIYKSIDAVQQHIQGNSAEKTHIKQTNAFMRWGYDTDKTLKPFIM